MSRDDSKIVDFPITPEERARRLKVEVDRLASLPPVEWRFYLSEGVAEKHGISRTVMNEMIEATIKANEKKAHEAKVEDRQREQRVEKERATTRREQERKQREQKREQELADRDAQRRQRDIDRAFATIIKLPSAEHDSHLMDLATRLGEDLNTLRAQFAELLDAERQRRGIGDVEPWDQPVNVNTLLNDIQKQRGRYVIIHDENAGVATTLWVAFSWVHDTVAKHSPFLLITSGDPGGDTAKTTLCGVIKFLTPRAKTLAELTGASFFHLIDHIHPTLIIDNAENLFRRRSDLIELLNVSWTRGTPIVRQWHGATREYDVFCPKVIGAIAGSNLLPPNSIGRSINIKLLPKLAHEKIEEFSYEDDNEFLTLRRKLARFAVDNAEALKNSNPVMPAGFDNRLRGNWKLSFAIADLAGSTWPKRVRHAAMKLTQERDEPSEGKQLLKKFRDELFPKYKGVITSAQAQKEITADPTSDWANYHGRGPITQWGIANILRRYYDIPPGVIHPRGRPADRGYKVEWFATAFLHYLGAVKPNEPGKKHARKRTPVRKQHRGPKK
jgi:putative DNA primase/helicase